MTAKATTSRRQASAYPHCVFSLQTVDAAQMRQALQDLRDVLNSLAPRIKPFQGKTLEEVRDGPLHHQQPEMAGCEPALEVFAEPYSSSPSCGTLARKAARSKQVVKVPTGLSRTPLLA